MNITIGFFSINLLHLSNCFIQYFILFSFWAGLDLPKKRKVGASILTYAHKKLRSSAGVAADSHSDLASGLPLVIPGAQVLG